MTHVYLFLRTHFSTKLIFSCNFQNKRIRNMFISRCHNTAGKYSERNLRRNVCTFITHFFYYVTAVLWDFAVTSSMWNVCLSDEVNFVFFLFKKLKFYKQFCSRIIISVFFNVFRQNNFRKKLWYWLSFINISPLKFTTWQGVLLALRKYFPNTTPPAQPCCSTGWASGVILGEQAIKTYSTKKKRLQLGTPSRWRPMK